MHCTPIDRLVTLALAAMTAGASARTATPVEVTLTRLDCGIC